MGSLVLALKIITELAPLIPVATQAYRNIMEARAVLHRAQQEGRELTEAELSDLLSRTYADSGALEALGEAAEREGR